MQSWFFVSCAGLLPCVAELALPGPRERRGSVPPKLRGEEPVGEAAAAGHGHPQLFIF